MNIALTERILFNPLFTSKLLLMALAGSNKNQLKVELIYFILPLKSRNKKRINNYRNSFK